MVSARDLVQAIVVEFGAQRGDALPDPGEIAHPVPFLVGLALEKDLNLERVVVEPRITVTLGDLL